MEDLYPPGSKVMKETDPLDFPTPLELDDLENMLDNILAKQPQDGILTPSVLNIIQCLKC